MPTGFPPQPIYPNGIDSDSTLYQVYNTTEAPLTLNNEPWAEEVHILPQKSGQEEIWANNGFATINGEMFYYDAVDKDDNGFVKTLKRCIRNLGGTSTQANLAGTMVRGFVMAEHHNQLVNTVLKIEQFVGENFTNEEETLDWRVRNLQSTPIIFDDFDCPDVNFTFNIVSNDPATGILANYFIEVSGTYNEFVLNFGDGTFTRSVAAGSHRYAPNGTIDPIITISNDKCQIVQSPINRSETTTPQDAPDDFTINLPVPVCPEIGDVFITPVSIPPQDIVFPPIVFPCLDVNPFPSTFFGPISIAVDFAPLNIPSVIDIVVPSIPPISITPISIPPVSIIVPTISIPPISIIVPSIPNISITVPEISITVPEIPDINLIVPSIPDINVNVPEFPEITVNVSVPSIPDININVPTFPDINVNVPSIPDINVNIPNIPDINLIVPSIPDINVNVPSIPDINLIVPSIPDVYLIVPSIPDIYLIVPSIPDINVNVPSIPDIRIQPPEDMPCITFCDPPTIPAVTFDDPPCIPVCWGTPPSIPINVTVTCSCACCPSAAAINFAEPEFVDTFNPFTPNRDWSQPEQMEINYDFQGFPSVIMIEPPVMPDIKVVSELPSSIELIAPDKMVIEYVGPAIPSTIVVVAPEKPFEIQIVAPSSIKLDTNDIIDGISLIAPNWNPSILIDASMIPSSMTLDYTGPSSFELIYNGPSSIKLEMPDNPVIQMLPPTEAIPISVMLTLAVDGVQQLLSDEQKANMQCVAIVPCKS